MMMQRLFTVLLSCALLQPAVCFGAQKNNKMLFQMSTKKGPLKFEGLNDITELNACDPKEVDVNRAKNAIAKAMISFCNGIAHLSPKAIKIKIVDAESVAKTIDVADTEISEKSIDEALAALAVLDITDDSKDKGEKKDDGKAVVNSDEVDEVKNAQISLKPFDDFRKLMQNIKPSFNLSKKSSPDVVLWAKVDEVRQARMKVIKGWKKILSSKHSKLSDVERAQMMGLGCAISDHCQKIVEQCWICISKFIFVKK